MIDTSYKLLGITINATETEVKNAWRQKAKEFHPDRYQEYKEKLWAQTKFIEVTEAYEKIIKQIGKKISNQTKNKEHQTSDKEDRDIWKGIIIETSISEFIISTLKTLWGLVLFGMSPFALIYGLFNPSEIFSNGIFNGIISLAFLIPFTYIAIVLYVELFIRIKYIIQKIRLTYSYREKANKLVVMESLL